MREPDLRVEGRMEAGQGPRSIVEAEEHTADRVGRWRGTWSGRAARAIDSVELGGGHRRCRHLMDRCGDVGRRWDFSGIGGRGFR